MLGIDGKRKEDWFPGTIREAVTAARVAYPGCAIRRVEEMEWCWWITLLDDWAEGP